MTVRPPTPVLSTALPPPVLGTFVVSASALRLRDGPSPGAAVLAALPRGTVVQRLDLADDSLWSLVQTGKRIGWMATKYLTPEGHPTAPVGPVEEFPWMPIALGESGVLEVAGKKSNPRVVEYLQSTDLDGDMAGDDSTPWCSGFVNWCVEKSGLAGTNSAAARSWLDWGRPIKVPRRGCITVLSRKNGAHVGFYISKIATVSSLFSLNLLGGNQNNQVAVASYDPARLLGYRVRG